MSWLLLKLEYVVNIWNQNANSISVYLLVPVALCVSCMLPACKGNFSNCSDSSVSSMLTFSSLTSRWDFASWRPCYDIIYLFSVGYITIFSSSVAITAWLSSDIFDCILKTVFSAYSSSVIMQSSIFSPSVFMSFNSSDYRLCVLFLSSISLSSFELLSNKSLSPLSLEGVWSILSDSSESPGIEGKSSYDSSTIYPKSISE